MGNASVSNVYEKTMESEYGEGGIRTHERSPFNEFRVRRIRPLCHLSS